MPAPATPNVSYIAGDHSDPVAVSLPVFSAPFDGVNEDFILTQDWQCLLSGFARLALDTEHPDYEDFLLAHESELRDLGGGMVRWTRTYLKLPANYTEPRGTISQTFPGFSGVVEGGFVGYYGSIDGRFPLTKAVPVVVQREFYNTTDPENDITIQQKFQVTYGANEVPTEYVNNTADNPSYSDTDPSRTEYDALVTAGTYIVAEDTKWNRWMGNFYIAETYKVKAQ